MPLNYYPVFEGIAPDCTAGTFCAWGLGWEQIIVLSTLIILFFYGLIYAIAFSLHMEELKRSAKSYLLDAIFTIILAVMIVEIMNMLIGSTGGALGESWIHSYLGGAQVQCGLYGTIDLTVASPFDLVQCKLMEKAQTISVLYERVYFSAREPFRRLSMMWGLFGLPIYMQGAYVGQNTISDVYREVESYRMLAHLCVMLLIALNGYIAAVNYVSMNMLRMFLPIGIVLRSIPFTRGIGAFFIAVAIGFYVVFPILFVITDQSFVRAAPPYLDTTDTSNIIFPWPSFKGAVSILTMAPQTQTSSYAFGSVDIRNGAAELSRLYYGLILQPIVILSITLIFVRYLTSLFGGETQELFRLSSRVI